MYWLKYITCIFASWIQGFDLHSSTSCSQRSPVWSLPYSDICTHQTHLRMLHHCDSPNQYTCSRIIIIGFTLYPKCLNILQLSPLENVIKNVKYELFHVDNHCIFHVDMRVCAVWSVESTSRISRQSPGLFSLYWYTLHKRSAGTSEIKIKRIFCLENAPHDFHESKLKTTLN